MQIAACTTLACPIDRTALQPAPAPEGQPTAKSSGYRCANSHSYDAAREGYVNLLLVQHKSSLNPGDGPDMVAARRRVHAANLYAPVADRLFEEVRKLAAEPGRTEPLRIVDAGCGEGYYLRRLSEHAAACPDAGQLELAGTDISKAAVQAAAKRGDSISWAVANNRHLPFVAGSIDLIVSMFGFAVWDGFKPVQAPGGRVLLVDPGPDHLLELREVIYPTVKRGEPPTLGPAMAAGYRLEDSFRLRFQGEVASRALLQDLVAMTPHASRMPLAGREALGRLDRLTVTFDVAFRMLRLSEQPQAAEPEPAPEAPPPDEPLPE